jgi:hypothetical protein
MEDHPMTDRPGRSDQDEKRSTCGVPVIGLRDWERCAQELGRGLLWGLPLAAAAPLLALLGNIALMRLPVNSQWRRYPYNWQYAAGLLLAAAGIYGTVFFHSLTDDAHRAAGAYCNGLYGWLTVVFGAFEVNRDAVTR